MEITLTVLDTGSKIILANLPDDKHIICSVNNDIAIRIPSHPYVLVNRSGLCNCGIEVEKFSFRVFGCLSQCKFKIGLLIT